MRHRWFISFFKKWCRQIKKLPVHTGTCLFDRKLLRLGLVYSAAGVRGSFNIKTKRLFRLNPAVLQIRHQSKTRTRTLWCRCGTDWGSVCQPHRINFRWVWFMTQGDHDHHSTLWTLAKQGWEPFRASVIILVLIFIAIIKVSYYDINDIVTSYCYVAYCNKE